MMAARGTGSAGRFAPSGDAKSASGPAARPAVLAVGSESTPLAVSLYRLCVAVARRGSASRASRLRGCLMPADAVAGAFWPCHGNGAGSVTGVGRESGSSAARLASGFGGIKMFVCNEL